MKKFISAARYIIVIPIIGLIIVCAGLVIMGLGRIITGLIYQIDKLEFSQKSAKVLTVNVIEIVDLFLVATVAYIVAVGLFKLFIGQKEIKLPVKLSINDMADLENKVIGVLVTVMAISFIGFVTSEEAHDLLQIGGGIAMVIVALGFFTRYNTNSKAKKEAYEKTESLDTDH